jgi:hypothetical protein
MIQTIGNSPHGREVLAGRTTLNWSTSKGSLRPVFAATGTRIRSLPVRLKTA